MKKKKIMEILDSNEVIIGAEDKPSIDNNADTQVNSVTDKVVKVSHQPYDDKFWATFGFGLYETLSEEQMAELAENIVKKRTDKSMKEKKDSKDIVAGKKMKIKDLFADLSDAEKGDLIDKLKKK